MTDKTTNMIQFTEVVAGYDRQNNKKDPIY